MSRYLDKFAALAVTGMALVPMPVSAADAGMPQFDSSTFVSQLFWLAVTFIVLFILMWKVALPRVSETLDNRQQKIAADITRAEDLKANAEKAQLELNKVLADARAEAQAVIAAASAEISRDHEKKAIAFAADLENKTSEAEKRIAEARKAALESVSEVATEVTQAIVEKLGGKSADSKIVAAALDATSREG